MAINARLFQSLTTDSDTLGNTYLRGALFDYENLVHMHECTRADLRVVENYDDEVAQCIETITSRLIAVPYTIAFSKGDPLAERVQQLVDKNHPQLITSSWRSRLYGYSVQERVYEEEGSRLFPTTVVEKPFEWYSVGRLGELYNSSDFHKKQPLDTQLKFLLTRHQATYTCPAGKPVLAHLFWPWFHRSANRQFRMQFLERTGQPMLIGSGPNPAQISQQLRAALMDAVIATGTDTTVSMLEATSKGEAFELAEASFIKIIQKVLVGQTLTSDTGANGVGSRALGGIHENVLESRINAGIELGKPSVQNYINAIYTINAPGTKPPVITYATEKGIESARAFRDSSLINSGALVLSAEYFEREYGFKKGDIVSVGAPPKAPVPNATPN